MDSLYRSSESLREEGDSAFLEGIGRRLLLRTREEFGSDVGYL